MFAHGGSAVPLGVYLLRWCGEKENTLAVLYVIFAVGNFLIRGLTRRLRRGVQVQSRGVVNSLWQTNRGGAGGERKAPCKRHYKATLPKAVPAGGLTRRLRRGRWDCRTEGGKYFLSKRKKVPKKAGGTATPEAARPAARRGLRSAGALRAVLDLGSLRSPAGKKASIAHFDGGARNVARNGVGQLSPALGARSCSPFSAVKIGGPFSLRCLSPLCSPAVGVVQTYPLRVGRFVMTWIFLHRKRPAWFQIHAGLFKRAMRPVAEWRSMLCKRQGAAPN